MSYVFRSILRTLSVLKKIWVKMWLSTQYFYVLFILIIFKSSSYAVEVLLTFKFFNYVGKNIEKVLIIFFGLLKNNPKNIIKTKPFDFEEYQNMYKKCIYRGNPCSVFLKWLNFVEDNTLNWFKWFLYLCEINAKKCIKTASRSDVINIISVALYRLNGLTFLSENCCVHSWHHF